MVKINWDTWYSELKKYYDKYGDINNIPDSYVIKGGYFLKKWLIRQKHRYALEKLDSNQIYLLEELKIIWHVNLDKWYRYYNSLKEYYNEHGNINNIPYGYVTDDGLHLQAWIYNQKAAYVGRGSTHITKEQINLLEELGIEWDLLSYKWNVNYEVILSYYNEHGNSDIKFNCVTRDGLNIGKWSCNQRVAYKNNLSQNRRKLLNDIDFDWSPKDTIVLNKEITINNKDKYYHILHERTYYILRDLSCEISNQITNSNQEELCKTLVKRIWR